MCVLRRPRSAAAAGDLLASFVAGAPATKGLLVQRIAGKSETVWRRFSLELHATLDTFHQQKVRPSKSLRGLLRSTGFFGDDRTLKAGRRGYGSRWEPMQRK